MNLYNLHNDPAVLDHYAIRLRNPAIAWIEATTARQQINGHPEQYEPYLMKSPLYAYMYADRFLQRRWKEAEPYIMKDPKYAFYYARDVIPGRWREAEPYIRKDEWIWEQYIKMVDSYNY